MNTLLRTAVLNAAKELCPVKSTGRPRTDHAQLLDSFLAILTTGMQWRALRGIDFRTAHRHFIHWARVGVFQLAYRNLRRLSKRKTRKGDFVAVDTTYVKSIYGRETIGPNPTDRGRMATKLLAVVERDGLPQKLAFFAANKSDHSTRRQRRCVPRIARRGSITPIWQESRRRVVERFFSWLDKSRRLIVRYDFTIAAYAAWTWLACARLVSQRLQYKALFFSYAMSNNKWQRLSKVLLFPNPRTVRMDTVTNSYLLKMNIGCTTQVVIASLNRVFRVARAKENSMRQWE